MSDRRLANRNWLPGDDEGKIQSWERVNTAILLDIRDELQKLNRLLHCPNVIAIPEILRRIRANTAKPRKKRRPA